MVDGRFMQVTRTFEISPFQNEGRINLRTVGEDARGRLRRKVDDLHNGELRETKQELKEEACEEHDNQKAKWLREKAEGKERARVKRLEGKICFAKAEEVRNKLHEDLSEAQNEKKILARQILCLKAGNSDMAKESAQLRQDVSLLQEKHVTALTEVKGAKAQIESRVGDMHELAYEFTKLKHTHNLDCWRLNKLGKQKNEKLPHQLSEASISLFCAQYIICISFIYFFFPSLGKSN
jgi:hypothetical protein